MTMALVTGADPDPAEQARHWALRLEETLFAPIKVEARVPVILAHPWLWQSQHLSAAHLQPDPHRSELKAKDLRLMYISCSCCSSLQLLFSTARFTLLL